LAGDTASLTGLTTDRFMSTDPIIQAPSNLQSHNRCADVVNNPLNLTDPSGFSAWTRFRDKILKPVVFAYIGYLTGGLISNALISGASTGFAVGANGLSTAFVTLGGSAGSLTTLGGVLAGAGGGFVAGALSSGTLDGGLRGALTGGVFGGIGATGAANGWGAGQYVAAHAAGGCITSVAGGGACGSGAASAAFGKFTTIAIGDVQGDFAKGVASTVAGGVGSVIAGGKFENGATTAAFGYLFNHLMSVGANIRVPLVGGAKFAVGVSYENGKWDAGVIIDSDIPTLGAGKYIAKATADISYQTGDFESNHGAMSQNLQVGAKSVGVSIQRWPEGVNGAGISLGPQLGVQVSAQQSRTISVRSDVVPAVNRAIDRVKSWFGN
jgi:hypothetical protein